MEKIKLEYIDVFDENKKKYISFDKSILKNNIKNENLFVTMVAGQSMEPYINHKAILVVNLKDKILEDKKIYVLYYDNKMWVKQYDKKNEQFISINKKYKHLVYKKDSIHLVGKVEYFK